MYLQPLFEVKGIVGFAESDWSYRYPFLETLGMT